MPRTGLATFWAIVSAITLIGLIPALAWGVTLRRQPKRFEQSGIAPLWASAAAAAGSLGSPHAPGTPAEPQPLG